jgi:hypothetical protein
MIAEGIVVPQGRTVGSRAAANTGCIRRSAKSASSGNRHHAEGTVTPIMSPSRTIEANCASLHPSVPVGRIGSTIQR